MRVLILSSSTGGGHDMRAKSFVQWAELEEMRSFGIITQRYQGLEETSKLYGFGVSIYNIIQKKWPRLHHLYFNFLELFQISAHKRLLLGKAHYIQALQAFQPDLILSVHAHLNHAFREIAKDTLPNVKFVTYCGEMFGGYGFSRHWVDPSADAFIGATKEICQAAIRLKMPADRVLHGGFTQSEVLSGPAESLRKRSTADETPAGRKSVHPATFNWRQWRTQSPALHSSAGSRRNLAASHRFMRKKHRGAGAN